MKLLDLFCGAGGAAMGYHQAGFEVVGVDIRPQPHYPFEFHQAEALIYLSEHWSDYDAYHTSPPCLASATLTKGTNGTIHPDLIGPTRQMLRQTGKPYVIENVGSAELRWHLMLCGEMFGLAVLRHRFFECGGFTPAQPVHLPHRGRVQGWRHGVHHDGPYVAVYGAGGGGKGKVAEQGAAMGIDWMYATELVQAIPPAYTHYVGCQLLEGR
jgi:DNA (cytosine-5)-methyltransferase 1